VDERAVRRQAEANKIRERQMAEKVRHAMASLMAGLSSAVVGTIVGLIAGVQGAVSELVQQHPLVAVSLGAGLVTFMLQAVLYAGPISAQLLSSFALRGTLVTGVTAIAAGIGAGLYGVMGKREVA